MQLNTGSNGKKSTAVITEQLLFSEKLHQNKGSIKKFNIKCLKLLLRCVTDFGYIEFNLMFYIKSKAEVQKPEDLKQVF